MLEGLLMRGGNQPWNDGVIFSWQAGFYPKMSESHDIDQSFLTWVSLEDPDASSSGLWKMHQHLLDTFTGNSQTLHPCDSVGGIGSCHLMFHAAPALETEKFQ